MANEVTALVNYMHIYRVSLSTALHTKLKF